MTHAPAPLLAHTTQQVKKVFNRSMDNAADPFGGGIRAADAPVVAIEQQDVGSDDEAAASITAAATAAASEQPQPLPSLARRSATQSEDGVGADWTMVTPGGSPRGSSQSACSESGAQAELTRLALADSILAPPAAAASAEREGGAADAPCRPLTPRPLAPEVARGGGGGGAGAGPSQVYPPPAAPITPRAGAERAGADGDDEEENGADADADADGARDAAPAPRCPALAAVAASGAGDALRAAGATAGLHLAIVGRWLLESAALLAQGAAAGGALAHEALRAAAARLLGLLPRAPGGVKGAGGAAAVDWRATALAGGLAASAAAAVLALYRSWGLGGELAKRDRELARLVVRLMSLQEALAAAAAARLGAAGASGAGVRAYGHGYAAAAAPPLTTHAAFLGFARSFAYL